MSFPDCPCCGDSNFTLTNNTDIQCDNCLFTTDTSYFLNNPKGPFMYDANTVKLGGHNMMGIPMTNPNPLYAAECTRCGLLINAQAQIYNGRNLICSPIKKKPPVLGPEPKTPVIIVYPKCKKCGRELCQELDACYSSDPNDIMKCSRCRR